MSNKTYYVDFGAWLPGNGESKDSPARSVDELYRMVDVKDGDTIAIINYTSNVLIDINPYPRLRLIDGTNSDAAIDLPGWLFDIDEDD